VGQSGSNHWKSHRAQILNIEFNPYFDDNDNDRDEHPAYLHATQSVILPIYGVRLSYFCVHGEFDPTVEEIQGLARVIHGIP
jgi:hypothetical protein